MENNDENSLLQITIQSSASVTESNPAINVCSYYIQYYNITFKNNYNLF